jgi:hypothetical protein
VIVTAVSAADATAKGAANSRSDSGDIRDRRPVSRFAWSGPAAAVCSGLRRNCRKWRDVVDRATIGIHFSEWSLHGAVVDPAGTDGDGYRNDRAGVTASALVSLDSSASSVGLVAYLPFDETSGIIAHDASGTLKCNGGCLPIPAWIAGIVRGA